MRRPARPQHEPTPCIVARRDCNRIAAARDLIVKYVCVDVYVRVCAVRGRRSEEFFPETALRGRKKTRRECLLRFGRFECSSVCVCFQSTAKGFRAQNHGGGGGREGGHARRCSSCVRSAFASPTARECQGRSGAANARHKLCSDCPCNACTYVGLRRYVKYIVLGY